MRKKLLIPTLFCGLMFTACNNSQPEKQAETTQEKTETPVEQTSKETIEQPKNDEQAEQNEQSTSKVVKQEDNATYKKLSKGNIKVKGPADIEGFAKAILPVCNDYYTYPENLNEVDEGLNKKAGFWSASQEGDGLWSVQCCYWNRTDKKKLVAFSEKENYNVDGTHFEVRSCLCFFVYNDQTKELEPIEAPINGSLNIKNGELMFANLPEKGKDIVYTTGKELGSGTEKILKWNGMGFDVK